MPYRAVITDTASLTRFCEQHASTPLLAIDTEFVRESTYYPRLCLIQLAPAEGEAVAVDMLAEGLDPKPLRALMQHPQVLKIFHAGKQDLEILSRLFGFVPAPLFDTQIAAQLLGGGDQIGYEALVREALGHALDKSQQYTNWARRPLSEKQLIYALNDVVHLRDLYPVLIKRLQEKGRRQWMEALMQPLTRMEAYQTNPEEAWRRLSRRSKQLSYLARLRMLSEVRETEAEKRDLPRQWIFTDDTLQELALHPPKSPEQLRRLRLGKSAEEETYDAILGALEVSDPARFTGSDLFTPSLSIPKESETLLDLLKLVVKITAEQEQVSMRLLATGEELIEIALGAPAERVLHGWRYALAGSKIDAFLQGKLALRLGEHRTLQVCEV